MVASIAFVHGGGGSSSDWDALVSELRDVPTIAVDLAGRGADDDTLRRLTLDDFEASAAAQIRASGADSVVVVGHSLGGVTLPGLGRRLDRVLSGFVLLSCILPREGECAADSMSPERLDVTFPGDGLWHPVSREGRNGETAGRQREPEAVFRAPVTYAGIPEVPTTLVVLDRDEVVAPRYQEKIAASLRPSRTIHFGADHWALKTNAPELAALLRTLVL